MKTRTRKATGALKIALLTLSMILVGASTAAAIPPEFGIATNHGRPGFSVKIIPNDPCPVIQGITQRARVMYIGVNSATNHLDIDINQSTGVWDSNRVLPIPTDAVPGIGRIDAYCFNTTGYAATLEYDDHQYTVSGEAPKFAIGTKVARGERLFVESLESCPVSSTSIQVDLRVGQYGQNYPLGASLWPDGSWKTFYPVPMNMPLGVYRTDILCNGSNLQVRYPDKQIEIVASPQYVALGDSYSSGEGTGNYISGSGECHRSENSYAFYVATQRNLGAPSFGACSGAQTADYYGYNPVKRGEGAQQGRLQAANQTVTIAMGGNDAGFVELGEACATYPGHDGWGCQYNYPVVNTLYDRLGALAGSGYAEATDGRQINGLKAMYQDIAYRSPNAKIFVGGYPKLFGDDFADYEENENAPSGRVCDLSSFVNIDYNDAQWLNQVAEDLNTTILNAVNAAKLEGTNVYYVPPALFANHGNCDSQESWIGPVILTPPPAPFPPESTAESLHPTAAGQSIGYGSAFVSVMNYND